MPNALIHESSPYLLQHAENPVDWHPWGDAAFAKAAEEGKLVFLSIGYSTCHWCHVMAHESFENTKIAEIMNHHFVCVKVDREQMPDIDAAYMSYIQASSGQGGWPMSVWLTPTGMPVFGGTYFPPEDKHGRPGFPRVCHELARIWRDDRSAAEINAANAMKHLQDDAQQESPLRGLPDATVFGHFIDRCEALFDSALGGFGGAPKFPRPVVVRTLMQLSERFGITSDEGAAAWSMSERTLRAMAAGGMHDQLGGGFHRYSVDRYWHVPHFEKMLYDQGQIAMAYLDAWQISTEPYFREVCSGIFSYLLETTRDSGGAFHAAEDADSLPTFDAKHTREGAYWTWSAVDISAQLAPRDAAIFCAAFGVEAEGNARPESDPHGELTGQNTLFRAMRLQDLAAQFDSTESEIQQRLTEAAKLLIQARILRPQPHRDDKIVTAWNGLAIGALARGGRLWQDPELITAANEAAEFLRQHLWHDGQLFRSYRGHRGTTAGFPADYVFLISGLIELHAARPDGGWLEWIQTLQETLDEKFWEASQSGYVMRPSLAGESLMIIREDYDGAEPSPNHLAVENLLKLGALLDRNDYTLRAEALLRAGSRMLETQCFAVPLLVAGHDLFARGVMKFQIPSNFDPDITKKLRENYYPRAVFCEGSGDRITICEGVTCRIYP